MTSPPTPPSSASPSRAWRAACPNCGAPVEFRSAASASAVCSYCRSTLVRDGEALRRIGQSAELFDDHSPIRLGAAGRRQDSGFLVVGRRQFAYADGTWNEWHLLFDDGRRGWLSEDNGRYVMAFDAPLAELAPVAEKLQPGTSITLAGRRWSVGSVTRAKLLAAEGELPAPPPLAQEFLVVDVRNAAGEVGTLDYEDPAAPGWSIGRSVALAELAMSGLAEGSEKTLSARGLECPSCGNALAPTLSTTQSIVCPQCHAVVDLSRGVGADLAHYAQDNGSEPQIPLGSTGTLALGGPPLPWQVVGYVERCELPDDPNDEQVFWREYLLYHRTAGFAFLVDAEDGWSWTLPLTGAPEPGPFGLAWRGERYRKLYDYRSRVTYVLGEFYWRLARDARTEHIDYQGTGPAAAKRLNRERSGGEVVWSGGESLRADVVARAFGLAGSPKAAALTRDAAPVGGNAAGLLGKAFFWMFLAAVLFMMFRCDGDDGRCDDLRATYGENSSQYASCLRARSSGAGLRTGGSSWGGFSTGGGHK